MPDRKELKKNAREAIRQTKPSPIWVTLAVMIILTVTQVLSLSLNGDLEAYRAMLENAANGEFVLIEASGATGIFPWLLTLALDLMTMVISMGYSLYALRTSRRKNPGFGDVFDAFSVFLRVIVLSLLRSILISLVSVVYVLPTTVVGVLLDPAVAAVVCLPLLAPIFILAYAYRFADFILLDNRGLPAIQCLGLSRMAMKGKKWDMFKLDLSFLGWLLLCLFPPVMLWVRPYMQVTVAGYYDAVMPGFMEELRSRPMPQPPGFRGSNPGDWSIPGEKPDDDDDDDFGDDDDMF